LEQFELSVAALSGGKPKEEEKRRKFHAVPFYTIKQYKYINNWALCVWV
jgi:hypothetical protein